MTSSQSCPIIGAIYSVVSFFACVAPRAQFALFGIVPMPAWLFVTGVFLIDGYSALNNKVCLLHCSPSLPP